MDIVHSVKEAVIISKALEIMLQKMREDYDLYEDKKLYEDTWRAVNSLRMKYFKIALIKMRQEENGEFKLLGDN